MIVVDRETIGMTIATDAITTTIATSGTIATTGNGQFEYGLFLQRGEFEALISDFRCYPLEMIATTKTITTTGIAITIAAIRWTDR